MNIREKFEQYAKYRETVRQLSDLSNRQLGDLGISRAEIKAIARTVSF